MDRNAEKVSMPGNPLNLVVAIIQYGGVRLSRLSHAIVYFIKSLLFFPFCFWEYLFYSRKIKAVTIHEPPVFIIGHHRSGTTYLQKLLTADKRFCFLKNEDLLFPSFGLPFRTQILRFVDGLIRRFRIETFAYRNTLFELDEPQEEETSIVAMFNLESAYWGYVFPVHAMAIFECYGLLTSTTCKERWQKTYLYYLKRLTLKSGGKPLILKSPYNTARIPILLKLFPEAKFVFIHRNPYDVFYSMKRLWQQAIQALSLGRTDPSNLEEVIFRQYVLLHEAYEQQKHLIPNHNLIEISYDDLKNKPEQMLKEIIQKFRFPNPDLSLQACTKVVFQQASYSGFSYIHDQQTDLKINLRLKKYIEQWNYHLPS